MTPSVFDFRRMNSITIAPGSVCKACICVRMIIAPICCRSTILQFGGTVS
jgi:hypothetical protein